MKVKQINISTRTKLVATTVIVAMVAGSTIPSIAADTSASPSTDVTMTNTTSNAIDSTSTTAQDINAAAQECADLSNPNGLAAASKSAYQDRNTLASAMPNTDKIFDVANSGGCFNVLKDFPNLSVAIPDFTAIATALKTSLIKYAKRKVCNAVNDALSEMIDPINDAMDKVAVNGEIDLTGAMNTVLITEAYKIDRDLGRVTVPVQTEYEIDSFKDVEAIISGEEIGASSSNSSSSSNTSSSNASSSTTGSSSSTSNTSASSSNTSASSSSNDSSSSTMKSIIDKIF